MLENWFIMLPEICIISFFALAFPIDRYRKERTSKTFFTLAQFFLLATISATLIFYNKSAYPSLWQNTPLSTLFKIFAYLLAWAWFYLSSKWFLNKNRPSFQFYGLCLMLLLMFDILASSSSLLTLMVTIPLIFFLYYKIFLRHWDPTRMISPAHKYALTAIMFTILLYVGCAILYRASGSFEYSAIKQFLKIPTNQTPLIMLAVLLIVACFMFMMAFAPFHNWFVSIVFKGVLPVIGFITLVPQLIYLCALINITNNAFAPIINFISPIICVFSVMSLIVGALSANQENNIRRMFAFITVYCTGFTYAGLQGFSEHDLIASFAYCIISVLSLTGVYTIFLGLKSRGEYLSDINVINGFYNSRPYMSAALLVFMFSLIGLAPTLGFFGYLSVINSLVVSKQWWLILIIFFSLIFVASSCLQVVRNIYFEANTVKFDRADSSIYICLFIIALMILIFLINPAWLLRDAIIILGGL